MIRVRRATVKDLSAIARLLSELSGETLSEKGAANRLAMIRRTPGEEMMLAAADKRVVGLLAFRLRHNVESISHYGEVSALVVDKTWRGKGVGRLLMQQAEDLARRKKCLGLWLVSGFGREKAAHLFYKGLGFENNGLRFRKLLL